jgi:hypothetical protein
MKEIRALEGLEERLGVRKAETAPSRASGRRAANLVFGPRHRKRVRWLAKGSAAIGEGAGRGWVPSRSGTARGVTAPGCLRGGALGRRREIVGEPRRDWRGSPGVAQRSRRGEAEPAAGTRFTRARPNS